MDEYDDYDDDPYGPQDPPPTPDELANEASFWAALETWMASTTDEPAPVGV